MSKLFKVRNNIYRWRDIKTFLIRNQYNEILNTVVQEYNNQYNGSPELPPFRDTNLCFTLDKHNEKCRCGENRGSGNFSKSGNTDLYLPFRNHRAIILGIWNILIKPVLLEKGVQLIGEKARDSIIEAKIKKSEAEAAKTALDEAKALLSKAISKVKTAEDDLKTAETALQKAEKEVETAKTPDKIEAAKDKLETAKTALQKAEKEVETAKTAKTNAAEKEVEAVKTAKKSKAAVKTTKIAAKIATEIAVKKEEEVIGIVNKFKSDLEEENLDGIKKFISDFKIVELFNINDANIGQEGGTKLSALIQGIFGSDGSFSKLNKDETEDPSPIPSKELLQYYGISGGPSIFARTANPDSNDDGCHDSDNSPFCLPLWKYVRKMSIPNDEKVTSAGLSRSDFENYLPNGQNTPFLSGLTVGSVLWLYYYERMGIFKILGVLLDDYNYKGKYTISGNRNEENGNANNYSALMDMISTLHRLGASSNFKDRVTTYQRVLGVNIENNLGIESELNSGFFITFNKMLDHMLQYYNDKRLATAIRDNTTGRSSVATQTAIKDTINILRHQLEPFEYGRNQINTFLGIATVHATICILYNLRKEIGIPDQYQEPAEFIPAAYDILVAKKSMTLDSTNRFIVHDYCASYGYRLLTDIETLNMTQLTVGGTNSVFDLWLDDVEGWVEGYRNAYTSLEEKAIAMV